MKRALVSLALCLVAVGCGSASATPTQRSSKIHGTVERSTTASADTPGQPNTPCAATFTLAHNVLRVSVDTRKPGELVVEPTVNGSEKRGRIVRQDLPHIPTGVTVVRFRGVHSVAEIPTVLYTSASPGSAKSCSVVRRGDPRPR